MAPNLPRSLGRFEVVGFLAAGGMAELFLGRVRGPSGFTRPVVLKRILPHLARQPAFVDMFLDEARIVARVQHPNVVQVTELTHEGGELFMVMEYLEGESTAGLGRRLVARGETLEPSLAAFIVAEASAGLHAAHQLADDQGHSLGVVHRDVSPQNLFVTFDGGVKVLDFGIALAADRVTNTEAGQVKGKLDYMSPEQCLSRPLDRRSDVFALGAVLYELLTQRKLFKRPTPLATLKAILEEPVLPPSRLNRLCPPELERICLRALARAEGERYQTAAELRRDLLAAIAVDSRALPQEALAALMVQLFPDRLQEKREMLRRVREGSVPSVLPEAEVDFEIDVPAVDAQEPAAPRRRLGFVVGALGLVLALGGLAYALRPAAKPQLAQAPPVVVLPVRVSPERAREVTVSIDSTPSGATVRIGGEPRGVTPIALTFTASDAGVALELALERYTPVRETLSLDADQRLRFGLQPVPVKTRTKTKSKSPSRPKDPLNEKW